MRGRTVLLMMLAIATLGSTSGCVVAESIVLTTHMRHEAGVRDYAPDEIRAKQPTRRTVDVPAEPQAPATP